MTFLFLTEPYLPSPSPQQIIKHTPNPPAQTFVTQDSRSNFVSKNENEWFALLFNVNVFASKVLNRAILRNYGGKFNLDTFHTTCDI